MLCSMQQKINITKAMGYRIRLAKEINLAMMGIKPKKISGKRKRAYRII